MHYVNFGKTGLHVSRLAMGTGSNGWNHRSDQTALGLEGLANLFRRAYDQGVNFWDLADMYGSHPHAALALAGIPRDSIVIGTKTTSKTDEAVTADLDRFLAELKTDRIDTVLLHCMTDPAWPHKMQGPMEALSRAKEQGKIRAVGVSCHNFGAFCTAAETDWVEVVLARINYAGVSMDANPSDVIPVIQRMYDAGKGLYAMKVLGCGKLVKDVPRAMEFVFGLGTLHSVNIGMTSEEQLSENLALVDTLSQKYPIASPRD